MLGDILPLFQIWMTRKVNGFPYYLRKLFLIDRPLKESCYAAVNLKGVLSAFPFLVDVLMSPLKNLLYLFVMIAVPLISLQEGANDMQIRSEFLFGFILLSLVAGSMSNSELLTANGETFILSRQMRTATRHCLCSRSQYSYSMSAIGLFLVCLSPSSMFSFSFWYASMAGFSYLGSHQRMDMLQIRYFQRGNSFYLQASTQKLLIPLSSLISLYALYWPNVDLSFTPWLFCISALVYVAAVIPYLRFENSYHAYSELLTCLLTGNYEISKLDSSQMEQMGVVAGEKDCTSEGLQYRAKDMGYTLLNELFFRRYKRLIYKPVRFCLTVMAALWLTGACLPTVLKDNMKLTKDVLELLPPLVFLSYILSTSQRICKTMFMSCDASLLHYSYHHNKEAVLVNFRLRLRKFCYYSFLLTMVLCLYVSSTVVLAELPYTLSTLLLFDFALFCLAVFFNVHYLFVYCIFQPYNEQSDMKSPFMSILSSLAYFFYYFCMQLEGSLLFISGVLVATLPYTLIALLLVYRLILKTFHSKWWLRLLALLGSNRGHSIHSNDFGFGQE